MRKIKVSRTQFSADTNVKIIQIHAAAREIMKDEFLPRWPTRRSNVPVEIHELHQSPPKNWWITIGCGALFFAMQMELWMIRHQTHWSAVKVLEPHLTTELTAACWWQPNWGIWVTNFGLCCAGCSSCSWMSSRWWRRSCSVTDGSLTRPARQMSG